MRSPHHMFIHKAWAYENLIVANRIFFPNKRTNRSPGGVVQNFCLCCGVKIGARELASVVSGCLPLSFVDSHGFERTCDFSLKSEVVCKFRTWLAPASKSMTLFLWN